MGGPVQINIQYVLELLKFHVDKTRSGDKDTDVVAFRANVGTLLYPTQTKRMENIQNGDSLVYLCIGPILAPSNTPVNFGFTIVNSGYDTSNANAMLQVANTLSDFCDAICTSFIGNANIWNALNNDTKTLNALLLANCDGPVAADGQWVAIDILQQWTSNGRYERTTGPYIGTLPPKNPVFCHTDSNYTVTWRVVPKTDALGLLGMSSDGRVWYATHQSDYSWIPFVQLVAPSGSPLVDVSHAGSVDDLWHICGITDDGGIWHTMSMGEQWLDLRRVTSYPGGFNRVGTATAFGELHICAITSYDGNIWHMMRHTDGSWQPSFSNVKSQAGNPGTFTDVSCAGVAGELHLCGVTADGGLWHTIRHKDGTWTPFFDVKNQAGNPSNPAEIPPAFVDCSSAGVNGDLQLSGVTSDGSLWLTTRHAGGWWELFENVTAQAGSQGSFLSVSATQLFATWWPPQAPQPPQVTILGSETISVTLADLDPANPVLEEGPYSVDPVGLQAPLKIQWRGAGGATVVDSTASSTSIDFDMSGQILPQGHKEFEVSVNVTDRLGVSVSAQARIFIHVIDRGKGGG